MVKYPLTFHADAVAAPGIQSSWNIQSEKTRTLCSIPPEFEGPGGAFSPEDLFLQSLTNCFIATFKVYSEKSRIEFKEITVKSSLTVDFGEEKTPVMKDCHLSVRLSGCKDPAKARIIAEKTFGSGFILKSVKTHLTMDLTTVD